MDSHEKAQETRKPSPAWHGETLKARETRLKNGLTHFTDWTDAKQRIRSLLQ